MSRIGRLVIKVPEKTKVVLGSGQISVEGPLGQLSMDLLPQIEVNVQDSLVTVRRKGDSPFERSAHGLTRARLANLVHGVSVGFTKELNINGVGYRAELKGTNLLLSLGFSHTVILQVPKGVKVVVDKQTRLVLTGADKQEVGQFAADIRALKKPEPFKGKGIKYSDEHIRRKAGKAASSGK